MEQVFKQQGLNYKSVLLLKQLYLKFEERGLFLNRFTLKAFNNKTRKILYYNISNYNNFKNDLDTWALRWDGSIGFLVVKIEYLTLTNNSLARYGSRFEVNTRDLTNPIFKDFKLRRQKQQVIINREIDRYKRVLRGLLQDYQVAYKIKLDEIIKEQSILDSYEQENYVDVDYVVNGNDYYVPQQ